MAIEGCQYIHLYGTAITIVLSGQLEVWGKAYIPKWVRFGFQLQYEYCLSANCRSKNPLLSLLAWSFLFVCLCGLAHVCVFLFSVEYEP